MKIAITSKGTELDSQVDPRFGRALYILLVDPQSMAFEVLNNAENAGAFKGAGIQAATMIYNAGAGVLMTGYCGPKAFQTLQAAGIKVISDISGTVSEAVAMFNSQQVKYLETPNAEAHW